MHQASFAVFLAVIKIQVVEQMVPAEAIKNNFPFGLFPGENILIGDPVSKPEIWCCRQNVPLQCWAIRLLNLGTVYVFQQAMLNIMIIYTIEE